MTEQTETERAINALINLNRRLIAEQGKSRDVFQEHKDQIEIDAINYSISALKQQTEAERRIERVREYCENAIGEELYSLPHTEKEIMYVEMKQAVANYILEILEGKAE